MAVYTEIGGNDLAQWLAKRYSIERRCKCDPIHEGIENTNYLLVFEGGDKLILTIFEVWDCPMVDNYAKLCHHLASKGLPVPCPLPDIDEELVGELKGKPATLVPFIEGKPRMNPTVEQCRIIGRLAARLHLASAGFGRDWGNPRGPSWWPKALYDLDGKIPARQHALLKEEADHIAANLPRDVPQGICHCDLFRNNVLWHDDDNVSAVIDFYFGGRDTFIFDLAVCGNDWCVRPPFEHNAELLASLLEGYQELRRLTPEERCGFPLASRAAALRFWLSRLHDIHYPRKARFLTPHDPRPFEMIHQSCLRNAAAIGAAANA